MIIILIGVMAYIKTKGYSINNIALIVVGLFAFFIIKCTEVHRLYNSYEITDTSLIHTKGIITKKTKRLQFPAISDADVTQTVWQRLLGYGDVNVRLYSRDSTTTVKNISKPFQFMSQLASKLPRGHMAA
jgi:uncharacterized membrane protein YdbT with pleckstrin-like domain